MRQSTATQIDLAPICFDDRYELDTSVGRGRGSIVYRATKLSRDDLKSASHLSQEPPQQVALKVLLGIDKNPDASIKRIKREARALLACESPYVIRLYDYVAREDMCYLSMEYAEFGDLKRLFSKDDTILSHQAILKLLQGILQGVEAIHKAGIIHRDLKPENFLLMEDYQVKIADFGICLLPGEDRPNPCIDGVVGTFDYTAPESLKGGGYSQHSDLYSVGVSGFELLAGYLPAADKTLAASIRNKTIGNIRDLPVEVISSYPQLTRFFNKALSPDPSLRFKSASHMADVIEDILTGKSSFDIHDTRRKSDIVHPIDTLLDIQHSILDKHDSNTDSSVNIPPEDHGSAFFKYQFSDLKKAVLMTILYLKIFIISFFLGAFISSVAGAFGPYFFSDDLSKVNSSNLSAYDQKRLADFLNQVSGIGVFYDLYTSGRSYHFAITPGDDGKSIFTLSVKGWPPVEVDLLTIQNGPLEIQGKGLSIKLFLEKLNEHEIGGSYENIITGKTGRWNFQKLDGP